ncbi:hypothetical protein SCOCK_670026 [Actinacidiphila cocklensis]|uniref:Uncharacterized protein n=1 Tax=Actinacidiphila cocklensis TaxID=887465 RepID=A0A9W4GV58_9ACTN|nr:hypothetical protein SCOCK_670026 [Actinacidiphila cocklensis]
MEGRPAPAPAADGRARPRSSSPTHEDWTHGTTTTHRTSGPAARLRRGGPRDAARRLLLGRRLGLRRLREQRGRHADDPGDRPGEVRHAAGRLRDAGQDDGRRAGPQGEGLGRHSRAVRGRQGPCGLLVDRQRLGRLPVPLAFRDPAALQLDADRVGRAAGQGPLHRPGRAARQGSGREHVRRGQDRRPGQFDHGEGHRRQGDVAEQHAGDAGRQRRGDRRVQRRRARRQEEPVGDDGAGRCGTGRQGRRPGGRRRQRLTAAGRRGRPAAANT